MISKFLKKKNTFLLLPVSILFNLTFTLMLPAFFQNEIIANDPRFEKTAYNILHNKSTEIFWGDGKIMINPYEIQKGKYNNWYPIGYSLLLLIPLMTGTYYLICRTILQILLYSLIPVIVFKISMIIFDYRKDVLMISLLSFLSVCIYPIYLNFPVQGTDTGMITLINSLCLLLFFKNIKSGRLQDSIKLGIALSILFLFKPAGLFPYFVLITVEFFLSRKKSPDYRNIMIPLLIASAAVMVWGIRNLIVSKEFNVANSNLGYNLWLGNNEYTRVVLRNRIGDGAAIEDDVIPYFDQRWSFLKNKTEYEKDLFFRSEALEFIINHPAESIENVFWKFIGYWSPLRMREGHWSHSKTKIIITLFSSGPLILAAIFAAIVFFAKKEYKNSREKFYLIMLILLWMLPHLIFFGTARFRMPTDFCLIILSIEFLTGLFQFRNPES